MLRQYFDQVWFLPPDTMGYKYSVTNSKVCTVVWYRSDLDLTHKCNTLYFYTLAFLVLRPDPFQKSTNVRLLIIWMCRFHSDMIGWLTIKMSFLRMLKKIKIMSGPNSRCWPRGSKATETIIFSNLIYGQLRMRTWLMIKSSQRTMGLESWCLSNEFWSLEVTTFPANRWQE